MPFSLYSMVAFIGAFINAWREDRPLKSRDVRQVIMRQVFFTGLQALRLIAIAAVVLSVVTVTQSAAQLQKLGGADSIGAILVATMLRDLGPFVTVIVVVARSASAVASELATMKANGEIDSLRAVGVSPLSYLVVPRVLGGALSTLFLSMHFVWISLLVGYLTAQLFVDMSWWRYTESLLTVISPIDFVIYFLKTFVVGLLVFLIANYCGLRTSGAAFEVPQATTRAVVWSFMTCFVTHFLISIIYYLTLIQNSGLGGFI